MSENRQGWRSRRWGWLLVLIVWFTLEAISPSWGNPPPPNGQRSWGGQKSRRPSLRGVLSGHGKAVQFRGGVRRQTGTLPEADRHGSAVCREDQPHPH